MNRFLTDLIFCAELESVVSFWLLRVEKYLESVSALNRAMSFLRLWVLCGSTRAAAVIAADIARDGAPDLSLTFVAAIIMASERGWAPVRSFV